MSDRDDRARFGPNPPADDPTQDVGQFLAHARTPAGNPEETELTRRAVGSAPKTRSEASFAPPPRASAQVAPNPDNPWATEVMQKRAVVPENVAVPVDATPVHKPWGDTEVVSRASFGALSSDAPPRDDQLSPVSGTLVGGPALALEEQVTTIERRGPPRATPEASAPSAQRTSRATIAGAVVAFITGIALVIALVKLLGILPSAR